MRIKMFALNSMKKKCMNNNQKKSAFSSRLLFFTKSSQTVEFYRKIWYNYITQGESLKINFQTVFCGLRTLSRSDFASQNSPQFPKERKLSLMRKPWFNYYETRYWCTDRLHQKHKMGRRVSKNPKNGDDLLSALHLGYGHLF